MGCGLLNVLCLKCMGVCYGLLSVLWFAQCAMAYSMCVLCGMYVMSYVHGLTQLWGVCCAHAWRHEHFNTACMSQVGGEGGHRNPE